MDNDKQRSPKEDPRLTLILFDYLAAVEAGKQPDREQLIAENPEFADSLRNFFARDHNVAQAPRRSEEVTTPPTREPDTFEEATVAHAS